MNNQLNDYYSEDADGDYFNSYEDSSADLKFRSVKIDNSSHGDFFSSYEHSSEPSIPNANSFLKCVEGNNIKISSAPLPCVCPSTPFGIAATHFSICGTDRDSIIQKISKNLYDQHNNFDFSYMANDFMVRFSDFGFVLCCCDPFIIILYFYCCAAIVERKIFKWVKLF
jgi:hypothetical protein